MDSIHAEVAELVDALASGASGRKVVEVQVLSSVPFFLIRLLSRFAEFSNTIRKYSLQFVEVL